MNAPQRFPIRPGADAAASAHGDDGAPASSPSEATAEASAPAPPERARLGVRARMLLLAAAALLPLVLSAVYQMAVDHAAATARAQAELLRRATVTVQRVDDHLAHLDSFLQAVAVGIDEQLDDPAAVERKLRALHASAAHAPALLGLVDAGGALVAVAGAGWAARPQISVADRGYFRAAATERRFAVAGPLESRLDDGVVVVAARPLVGADGAARGAVLASYALGSLARLIEPADADDTVRIELLNEAGERIAMHPAPAADAAEHAPAAAAHGGAASSPLGAGASDGEVDLAVSALSARSGWTVRVSRPRASVFAAAHAQLREQLVFGIAALLIALAASWHLSRGLSGPLARLQESARRLAGGDLTARAQPEGDREIAALAATLNRMAGNLDAERKALADSRRSLAFALEGAEAGVWEWRREARRIALSGRLQRMLADDRHANDAAWHEIRDRTHPEDRAQLRTQLRRFLAGEQRLFAVDHRLRRGDGSYLWAHTVGRAVLRDDRGRPVRISGIVTDIGARKRAELDRQALLAAKQQLAERLRIQFEHMPIACAVLDQSMRIVDCNPAFERTFGFTRAQLVAGHPIDPIVPEDVQKTVERRLAQLRHGVELAAGVNENRTADGRRIVCEWYNTPLRDAAGMLTGALTMAIDVTERRAAELALRESEARFRSLSGLSSDWFWEQDESLRFTRIDGGRDGADSYERGQALGKRRWEMPSTNMSEADWAAHRALLARREPFRDLELQRVRADGSLFWIAVSGEPILDEAGGFRGYRGVTRDITERKLTQEVLEQTERRWQLALEGAGIGVWDWDLLGDRVYRSARVLEIYGVRAGAIEPSGAAGESFVHPEDRAASRAACAPCIAGAADAYASEHRVRWSNGSVFWVEERGMVVERDAAGRPVRMIGTLRDITERRRAEQSVRESERRYRTLFESSPDGIAVLWGGRIAYANRAMARVLRLEDAGAAIGREWESVFLGADRDAVRGEIARLLENPGDTLETERRIGLADGTEIDVVTSSTSYLAEGGMEIQAVVRDITVRKLVQRRVLQINAELERRVAERTAELEVANKALEAFSYTVAHDLRAPLRAIDGYCALLEEQAEAAWGEDARDLLRRARRNATLMGRLIEDLLEYGRVGRRALEPVEVDLGALAHALGEELVLAYPRTRFSVGALPTICGDRTLLRQAFANLIGNAFKFSAKAGSPEVLVGGRDAGDEYVLHVRDNGAGFSMDYADKLFRVFQRLHSATEFEGTGVGLAIVARAVERHRGRVWADGCPGLGATFYVALPKANDSCTAALSFNGDDVRQ